jgi:hypothetical protein
MNKTDSYVNTETREIITVADLKEYIKNVPDNTEVFIYQYCNTYPLMATLGAVQCENQNNGRRYVSSGLILEVS